VGTKWGHFEGSSKQFSERYEDKLYAIIAFSNADQVDTFERPVRKLCLHDNSTTETCAVHVAVILTLTY